MLGFSESVQDKNSCGCRDFSWVFILLGILKRGCCSCVSCGSFMVPLLCSSVGESPLGCTWPSLLPLWVKVTSNGEVTLSVLSFDTAYKATKECATEPLCLLSSLSWNGSQDHPIWGSHWIKALPMHLRTSTAIFLWWKMSFQRTGSLNFFVLSVETRKWCCWRRKTKNASNHINSGSGLWKKNCKCT